MDNKTEKMLNPTKTGVKLKTYFVYDDPQQILFWRMDTVQYFCFFLLS